MKKPSEAQKRGMAAFVDKGCVACHSGPILSNSALVRVQVPDGKNDTGRARTTRNGADNHFFKVPLLLNVAVTPPHTHNGGIADLPTKVPFKGKEMLKTELQNNEVNDIVAFLHALTGTMPASFIRLPLQPVGGDDGDFGPGLLPSGKNCRVFRLRSCPWRSSQAQVSRLDRAGGFS